MGFYEMLSGKNGQKRIVEIVGCTKKDVILKEVGYDFKFAVSWNFFSEFYTKLDTFDCDVNEYEGPDLSNF